MKNFLGYAAVILALSACGNAASPGQGAAAAASQALNPLGQFQSTTCFKNKLASEGNGQDIWTRASMDFRSDGSATDGFELYTDQNCANSIGQGSAEVQYTFLKTIGTVTVVQIDQLNDPNDPSSVFRYWILGVLGQDGYVMDIEYASGQSGPYVVEPGETEANAFLANINASGVLFRRQ